MLRRAALTAVALMIVAGPADAARTELAPPIDALPPPDCRQIPPEEVPPLEANGETLRAEVRVMADPPDIALAKEYMRTTRAMFARIGIKLRASYDAVPVPSTLGETSRDEYFEFMKSHYGGKRPPGVDVVYLFAQGWTGGVADCIGGVRFPDRAFAFGSVDYHLAEGRGPRHPTVDEGVIAGHELGHLFGAHHHYSNCAEALPSGAPRGDVHPCTTMSPLATTASSTFATLEASFIRHYAARHARG